MKKTWIAAVVGATSLLALPVAQAEVLPISIGAKASVTDVKYKGQTETGYSWEVSGTLRVTDYSSIYTGYGETTADFNDVNGIEREYTSSSIPVALQFNFPLVIGDVYLRGGGNYYQNEFHTEKDSGWGVLGAVGVDLSPVIGPGLALELTYADRGNAETSSVSVGANLSF